MTFSNKKRGEYDIIFCCAGNLGSSIIVLNLLIIFNHQFKVYQALNLYGSNGSPFYNVIMKELYRNKIDNNNLHLLIVSGLYGILKYNDRINDYHLNIDKGPDIWDNSILLAVNNYIKENNIDNDAVFYSLSNNYLDRLNPVNIDWTNLWNNYGHGGARGKKQALDLMDFLNNL
jgi:hypothetical protein